MATVGSDGTVKSSGKGQRGLENAWRAFDRWSTNILRLNAAKVKAARKGR